MSSYVEYIVPDGVAVVDRGEGTKPLFLLFEQHNGKDTKRFLSQVHGHTLAISEGIPSIKYAVTHEGKNVSNRVFCVFELESCMRAAMHRLATSSDFEAFMRFFYFRTQQSFETEKFDSGWILANGKSAEI